MTVYKIEDWNDIISRVNQLAVNPDKGCDPVSTLEEVEAPHRWAKSDIEQVQDKLLEICDENEFSEIPELWKQSIVDEIDEAINRGWCGCEDDDDDDDEICQQDEETFVIYSSQLTCEVQGVNEKPCGQAESTCDQDVIGSFDWYSAALLLTGFGPGMGGFVQMRQRFYQKDGSVFATRALYSNTFRCNGTQSTPPPPRPTLSDGSLQWSTWIDHTVHCVECSPVETTCVLGFCITTPCHIGLHRCDTQMDGALALVKLLEEDCERYPYIMQFEVTRAPLPAFREEGGSPCLHCCSDGTGYKEFGDCPNEGT